MNAFDKLVATRKRAKKDGDIKKENFVAGILAEKENQRMRRNKKENRNKYEQDMIKKRLKKEEYESSKK